jgi:hypothetical protein
MSVKSFKFVSPGVFINEIDNSFIPRRPDAIGPLVIGRSTRGLAMQPVKVESFSDYVTQFGDTVAGAGGGDVYRNGNYQSPMYGTYAAKAFLDAKIAPLTYVRLLGQQTDAGKTTGGDAAAGWDIEKSPTTSAATNGGAYGLFVAASGAMEGVGQKNLGNLYHAATFYLNKGEMFLSGNLVAGGAKSVSEVAVGTHTAIATGTDGIFTIIVSGTTLQETVKFDLDDTSENFLRKKFNTNPQLAGRYASNFFPESSKKNYWLGESFEQAIRAQGLHSAAAKFAVLIPLGNDASTKNPSKMKGQAANEAKAGWFIGQDTGNSSVYEPENMQKLFRLIGRGHGAWLHKNCKVSIEKVRQSTSPSSNPYGSFSVVIRSIRDTDANVVVLERFDRCNLDPASPNYVARKIGNQYVEWNETDKRLRTYGDYPNQSNYVYVDMNEDVENGSTGFPELLPFGYFGPPKPSNITGITGSGPPAASAAKGVGTFVVSKNTVVAPLGHAKDSVTGVFEAQSATAAFLSGAVGSEGATTFDKGALSGSLIFPSASLRISASDGGLRNPKLAYFGFSANQTKDKNVGDASAADFHRMPYANYGETDPTTTVHGTDGIDGWSYVFSLDDVTAYYGYQSGSRKLGDSKTSGSYTDILERWIQQIYCPILGWL